MTSKQSVSDIPDISEYVKDHPEIKASLLYQMGQQYDGPPVHITNPSLKNRWYVVAHSSQLPSDGSKKISIQLFAQPIVIYRDPNGKAVACEDRCPHRSAPLSMGEIKQGILKCRYHDWQFGNNGKAYDIPAASKKKGGFVDKVSLFTIPCKEYDGYIYIYHGNVDEEKEPAFNGKNLGYDTITNKFGNVYNEDLADLDGVWMHHLENLFDYGHIFFIHKNRLPFQTENYAKDGPFRTQQYRDKRGFIAILEGFGIQRFDPPNTWVLSRINKKTGDLYCNDLVILNKAVPINKNHTRFIGRFYANFVAIQQKINRLVPLLADFAQLENYKVFREDNALIAGQSIRVDLLGAPVYHRPRGEDMGVTILYRWYGEAMTNDKNDVWFKSWGCDEKKKIKCTAKEYGTDKILVDDVKDIEDILSEPMMIHTPWGDMSATAMEKEYPPANLKRMKKIERKLFIAKCVFLTGIVGVIGFGGYKYFVNRK